MGVARVGVGTGAAGQTGPLPIMRWTSAGGQTPGRCHAAGWCPLEEGHTPRTPPQGQGVLASHSHEHPQLNAGCCGEPALPQAQTHSERGGDWRGRARPCHLGTLPPCLYLGIAPAPSLAGASLDDLGHTQALSSPPPWPPRLTAVPQPWTSHCLQNLQEGLPRHLLTRAVSLREPRGGFVWPGLALKAGRTREDEERL